MDIYSGFTDLHWRVVISATIATSVEHNATRLAERRRSGRLGWSPSIRLNRGGEGVYPILLPEL